MSAVGVIGAITRRIGGGPSWRRFARHEAAGRLDLSEDALPESVKHLPGELEALRGEVAELRRELDEAQNRLDFTERLLAQVRERGLLNAPKERGLS